MSRTVYADNAATTALSRRALEAMLPYLTDCYGNPSSIYTLGRKSKRALESARSAIGAAIGARADEIYFTGGGTEADNWAIRSAAELTREKGRHIITSAVEHHAVLHTMEYLRQRGYEITCLGVDRLGRISLDELRAAVREDTALISIMAANNEIGTVMPVAEIGEIARERGILFHTDAVQAVGHIPLDVSALNVGLLSMAAHKFRGPKGIGALYVRKGLRLPPLLLGGGQERGVRSGTENVAGAVGMAAALEDATAHMEENAGRISALRDRLIRGVLKIPYSHLTGDPVNRLPGTASFVFEYAEGEPLVLLLDREGICASSGSACSAGALDPSHVLLAAGLSPEAASGALRLSIGEDTSREDIDYILDRLPPIIERLRRMSPLWDPETNAPLGGR